MKATAQKLPCTTCGATESSDTAGNARLGRNCSCPNPPSPVVETSGDQPWAEFCESLDQPVFLMPVTGFADLE